MACKSSQEKTRVLVPKLYGLVTRITGKHAIRVKNHCVNFITMASEISQLITRVLVPDLDTVVTGATGKQMSGVKCNGNNTKYYFQDS